jgi:hypothetical protein
MHTQACAWPWRACVWVHTHTHTHTHTHKHTDKHTHTCTHRDAYSGDMHVLRAITRGCVCVRERERERLYAYTHTHLQFRKSRARIKRPEGGQKTNSGNLVRRSTDLNKRTRRV